MAYVDPYLESEFWMLARQTENQALDEQTRRKYRDAKLPMLMRVRTSNFSFEGAGFEERFRLDKLIACTGTRQVFGELTSRQDVIAIEMSRPVGSFECNKSIPFVSAPTLHKKPYNEMGSEALVAIIDDGIDVLHGAFFDKNSNSRILAVWDQRERCSPPSKGVPFGKLYTQSELGIRAGCPPACLNTNNSHGTHVASIAAGRRTTNFAGGMAPECQILVVIPDMQVSWNDPRSIGYSTSHIAALRFIKDFAMNEVRLPVVVNISAGMNAGAHDGQTLVEAEIDSLSQMGRLPGFIVVKSAGNARGMKRHAQLSVGDSTVVLEWVSGLKDPATQLSDDYIELWYSSEDNFEFTLQGPCGDTCVVTWDNQTVHKTWTKSFLEVHIIMHPNHHDNGDSRLAIRVWYQNNAIEMKTWRIIVGNRGGRVGGLIHAWIENREEREATFTSDLAESCTVTIPGTARTVITVGASAQGENGAAWFSSFGPTRDGRKKPEIYAPGENILAAHAGSNDDVISYDGTSMAAPHVTGAIALLLSRREKRRAANNALDQLNALQIQAALRQSARGSNGSWSQQYGFGVLDAEDLCLYFDGREN